MLKKGIRIVAIEDGPFKKGDKKALAIGIIARGSEIEGAISFYVDVDGTDATARIINGISRSRFASEIRLIALNSITMAGLNIVDIERLAKELHMPVVAITRRKPHAQLMKKALAKGSKYYSESAKLLERLSKIRPLRVGGFYAQGAGISPAEMASIMRNAVSLLRIAHIVASAVVTGESRGRM